MYSTTNHPIIPTPPNTVRDTVDTNVDTFFATISSSDRNVVKYPQANSFTVQLPQDYNNITAMSLHQSFIPNVSLDFSLDKNNVDLVFRFTEIEEFTNGTDIEKIIYVFVKQFIANNNYFRIRIKDGSYTQKQLTLEVQNRMNQIVTDTLLDYYNYKLKGIVIHTGTADSGHYYSFIRDSNDSNGEKWYEFNDNIVRDFDISELANECFGGEDTFMGANMINMKTQKWRNAYLTVYERVN